MTSNLETPAEILLVDDIIDNLRLLETVLVEQGYSTRKATNGKLALRSVDAIVPDLILLDINMPDMTGYEVCQQLKNNERTRGVPVIFISALNDAFDKVKAFQVGGVDYICKPFHAEEVLARVQTHIALYRFQKKLQEKTEDQHQQLQEQNILLEYTIERLEEANQELHKNFQQLQKTQLQLVQSEKMATLGQLVAGVAHEINNPVGFIGGNINAAREHLQDLLDGLSLYQEHSALPDAIAKELEDLDLEFVAEDFPKLIASMRSGCDRIASISTSLRTFSRTDTDKKTKFNLHEGIDSTLLILKYRLKANEQRPEIEIIKDYGDISEIKCYAGQINQVFMNILANAIDTLDESNQGKTFEEIEKSPNRITINTELSENKKNVIVRIIDNGMGMPEAVKEKIFEQGFTTKDVGKGTGLGMAIARQIVTEKHGGMITCMSELGKGTEFAIALPISPA